MYTGLSMRKSEKKRSVIKFNVVTVQGSTQKVVAISADKKCIYLISNGFVNLRKLNFKIASIILIKNQHINALGMHEV